MMMFARFLRLYVKIRGMKVQPPGSQLFDRLHPVVGDKSNNQLIFAEARLHTSQQCCGSGSVSFWSADPFHETKPVQVAKNQSKSWKISTKINQNHKNIIHLFKKILNLCLTDINIYPIKNKTDHFWRNIFLIEKKVKKKDGIFSGRIRSRILIHCFKTDPRIRIRIHIEMKRICHTASQLSNR